jgi:hypothetical protein
MLRSQEVKETKGETNIIGAIHLPLNCYAAIDGVLLLRSIENNNFLHNGITYQYEIFFAYYNKSMVNTDLGLIETKKIWFETYSVNHLNDVVMVYGFYFVNPRFGIVKKEYREEEINGLYTIDYNYTLTQTNK